MKSFIVTAIVFISLIYLGYSTHQNREATISNADNGGNAAFVHEISASTGEWLATTEAAIFENQEVEQYISPPEIHTAVLGSTTAPDGSEKWIEVDISDQKLYGWEGNHKVFEFNVSTGRPGYDTVQGEFRIWRKVKSQRYRGGTPGTSSYYNLPNVPYSLFFHKGYAIHGAYWHNDFGIARRSSGCVNISPDEAGIVFNWAAPELPAGVNAINSTEENPGLRVVVHE